MRIAVIGAGSMGSVFGGKLARVGHDVVLYDSNTTRVAAIADTSLTVTDPRETFTLRVAATTRAADITNAELAIVLVDSNATAAVSPLLAAMLLPGGVALTLPNGIGNVEALTASLGIGSVLGGSTYVSAAMVEPGHAHNTNVGDTVIGELAGQRSVRAQELATMISTAGLPTTATDTIMGHIWSKFALNCALNPLCAITGLRPGEIVANAPVSSLLDTVIAEIMGVVRAKGIALPETDPRVHIREHARTRYNKPSMLQHLQAGHTTEIAGLNEALTREAEAVGIPVPVNAALVALVRGIEARQVRGPHLDEKRLEATAARLDPA